MNRFAYIFILILALSGLSFHATEAGAATYSVTVPSGTEVVMLDSEAVIPATVTHNGPNKAIRSITFTVDTARYTIGSATSAPTGWCVGSVSAGSINFSLLQGSGACSNGSTASEMTSGGGVTFNIIATPASAASDVAGDTFSSVTVGSQGGFSLSGSLPTWTRRSLDATLVASPSSVGTGSTITVSMTVANQSTASHATVASTPDPPAASSPLVTLTGGPYYASTLLHSNHTSGDTTITVDSTVEFPSSGTIKVGTEEICYTGKTATTFTGVTRGCNSTTAAAQSNNDVVYGLTARTLTSGETMVVQWTFSADLAGTLYFTARAANATSSALSPSVDSNTVVIGDFTAELSLTPVAIISGQTITVTMIVRNNGTTALVNINPTALTACVGGASETYSAGPAPALISSIPAGGAGVFTWDYQVTGSVDAAYCLSGGATADGPAATNTAASNSGVISSYSLTVSPTTTASGSTGVMLTWTLHNGGSSDVSGISVDIPTSGGDWNCSSVAPPAGWSGGCADPVALSSGKKADDIAGGGTGVFSITFSTTETVTADKAVVFPVTITVRGGGGFSTTIGTTVTVTVYGITLTHLPAGPIDADGSAIYAMTATLTSGGSPLSGKTVLFSTTNGSLFSPSAVTDSNGEATVDLAAPVSSTDTTAIVTADYLGTFTTDTVNYTGWTGADLQYWGSLSPASIDCGSTYSFTMDVRNLSPTTSMSLATGSYFAVNDSTGGGSAVYLAYLDSPVTISASSTTSLSFGSATAVGGGGGVAASTGFITGTYLPVVNPTPPPAGGLYFTDGAAGEQYRTVTDTVTIGGPCGAVSVDTIEWHEMR